jgi:hypothetical protein
MSLALTIFGAFVFAVVIVLGAAAVCLGVALLVLGLFKRWKP